METRTLHEQRLRDDPSVVHRDVTISRETRDDLEAVADLLEGRRYLTNARMLREIVARWDANGATEILVTEDGFVS